MIEKELLKLLRNSKNLLAFSAGVDSTALFFILKEFNIKFDITIVNYGLREAAKEEIKYAKELAKKFNKQIYISDAPKFHNNFEANAREFRYNFFKKIITQNQYNNLITAHQLNDKIEWFLMRFSKGAGINTLSSMQQIENRDSYNLIRPLLNYTKEELLEYLERNSIKYFIDSSNFNKKYERNKFRPLVNELLKNSKEGFIKSFDILKQEAKILNSQYNILKEVKDFRLIKIKTRDIAPQAISSTLKELGYLISFREQQTLLKQNSLVIGRVWAIEIIDNLIYIAPYIKTKLPKEKKEYFRVNKIPPKVRGYLYIGNINPI